MLFHLDGCSGLDASCAELLIIVIEAGKLVLAAFDNGKASGWPFVDIPGACKLRGAASGETPIFEVPKKTSNQAIHTKNRAISRRASLYDLREQFDSR